MIYLDHNATSPVLPEVFAAMRPYLEEFYGNASSIHRAGREARAAIDDSRDRIARLLHGKPHEVIFTGGGTESDNLAILGLARCNRKRGSHLVTVATEHHAVLHAFEHLQEREGFELTVLPVDGTGRVDPEEVRRAIRPDTILVSVMSANNETGTLQPVEEIAAICREREVLFHSDMVQSFGKEPFGDSPNGPDAISLAAHKFGGPKGAGVLWLRSGLPIERLQHGGSHENERRPGTENVAAIVGMAVAAERAIRDQATNRLHERALRDQLWREVSNAIPDAIRNGHPALSLANTLNVSFPGIDAESALIGLDLEGICASSGSACMVGSIRASHVLLAMGVSPELAQSTVRFSLGPANTETEMQATGRALQKIAARLRALA